MQEKIPGLSSLVFNRITFILIILGIFTVFGVAGFLIFSKSPNLISKQPQESSLGSDSVSVLKKADSLKEKTKYLADYVILTTNSLEEGKSTALRRVERKHNNLHRVDFYLSEGGVAGQYIVNDQGTYGCLNFEDPNSPPCYNITDKLNKETEKLSLALKKKDIIIEWIKQGLISADVKEKTAILDGKEKKCDEVKTTLTGKSVTSDNLGKLISYLPDQFKTGDLGSTAKILEQIVVEASYCYDRQTGLPLDILKTVIVGKENFTTKEALVSLTKDPVFVKGLATNSLEDNAKKDSFERSLVDKDILYVAGEKGLYLLKDGKVQKYDTDIYQSVGRLISMIKFQDKLYVGGERGFYSYDNKNQKWNKELDYLKTFAVRDFIIYKDTLYAGTNKGVFVLKDSWQQLNNSFSDQGGVYQLIFAKNSLFSLSSKGLYAYDGVSWKQIISINSYGDRELFEREGRLFLTEPGRLTEILDNNETILLVEFKGQNKFYDVAVYNNDVFAVSSEGVYSTNKGLNLKADKVDWAWDLQIFQGSLYAASDKGVYKLDCGGWWQVNEFNLTQIRTLFEFDGALFAGGIMGVYRLNGNETIQAPVSEVNHFFANNGHLYVSSLDESILREVVIEKGDPKEEFDLSKEAKIYQL